jgi:hypothetical protein
MQVAILTVVVLDSYLSFMRHKNIVAFQVSCCLVVLRMTHVPPMVRDQQERVQQEVYYIIYDLPLAKCPVSTFVNQDRDTGHDDARKSRAECIHHKPCPGVDYQRSVREHGVCRGLTAV